MECPRCHQQNPDDARFCESCGAPLAPRCSTCGREVRAGARFCAGCGRTLEAGAAAEPEPSPAAAALPEREGGERRQLTVVFCDLVRSTELSARLDPEDWGAALSAYQKAADAVVTRYGGHVAQHLGDGLLAYFGWPHAMDDAAERAVRAGLLLIDAAGSVTVEGRALAARVGIHTGTVVVSALGDGASAETLALGQVPNVAGRVQSVAEPGTVVISAATQRLVAGLFVTEELGARALAGLPQPLALYRAVQASGVRGRIHAAATASRLTRFVGREQERQLLRDRWELAQEGEGQVVLITGEAGIGKSRLVQQLKEELGTSAHTWAEAAGSPYLQHTPFAPVAELIAQGFRFPAELPMAERVASVERLVAAMGLTATSAVPLLAMLLGLELPGVHPPLLIGPEEQRRRLMALVVELTLASARLQPTVVVMEDLHWMDASTLEFQALLVDQIATARVLLVLTARPEFRAAWPQRAHHAQLSLARLSRRQTRELIGAVAVGALAKSDLVETLVARTDGVPLFVEELTRAVAESGEAALSRDIPTTLQDTLMARLDRLGDAKAVAQVGAVLGREFRFADLLAVAERPAAEVEPALARLCDAELLYARGLGEGASYTFKHALVQQAAYESLLKSRRRELHARAATVLSRGAGTPPAVLALHFEAAGDAAQAVTVWQQAAEHARRSAASFEAAEHFRRAIAALGTLPESPERDGQELALQYPLSSYLIIAKGAEDPELHASRARARELVDRVGDATMTVNLLSASWAAAYVRGETRTALAVADQMLEIAEGDGAIASLVKAHANKAACHFALGEFAAAREHGERLLALYDADALQEDPLDRRVLVLSNLMVASLLTGRLAESRRWETEMFERVRARGIATDLAMAELQALHCAKLRRDAEGLVERARVLLDLCAQHRLEMFGGTAEVYSGWATARMGSSDEGILRLREGLRRTRATGLRLNRCTLTVLFVEACATAGRIDEALASLEDAFGDLGEDDLWRPDLLRLRGDLLAEQGDDLEAAEAAYRDAIERARAMGALFFELRAATGLARLLERCDRTGEAHALLAPVYARFTDGFDLRDLVEAKATLDALGAAVTG